MRAVVILALLLSACAMTDTKAPESDAERIQQEVREQVRQQCMREQIMRHGAGGPVPDFSTC